MVSGWTNLADWCALDGAARCWTATRTATLPCGRVRPRADRHL